MPSSEDRMLAAVIYVISFFTVFLGPLVIWLIKKDESSFVDYHGRMYFNFFISYTIYSIISMLLMLILIGFITIWLVGIYIFIFTVVGAIKAYQGEEYHIPFAIRML